MKTIALGGLLCFLQTCLAKPSHANDQPELVFSTADKRIVSGKPDSQPFVKTARGFMVAYRERVPGTDAWIEMIPIPPAKKVSGVDSSPFWMGRFEITVSQYRPYMNLHTKIRTEKSIRSRTEKPALSVNQVDAVTAPTEIYDPSFRFEFGESDDFPFASMTQYAARQYTKWLSLLTDRVYLLPTKSQWQHACRGGTTTKWSFGDNESLASQYAVCWIDPLGQHMPQTVGSRKPNPFGLHDMHGNLSEWVIDDSRGSRRYQTHLMCGGNWRENPVNCQSDSIIECDEEFWAEDPNIPLSPWWLASTEAQTVGFRIISPLVQPGLRQRQNKWNTDTSQLRDDLQYRVEEGRGSATVITPVTDPKKP